MNAPGAWSRSGLERFRTLPFRRNLACKLAAFVPPPSSPLLPSSALIPIRATVGVSAGVMAMIGRERRQRLRKQSVAMVAVAVIALSGMLAFVG